MFLRFLHSAIKFVIAVVALRSRYSDYLLDPSPPNTTEYHITAVSYPIMPAAVNIPSTIHDGAPTSTTFKTNPAAVNPFISSTIPPMDTTPTLGEPGFNLQSPKSTELAYSNPSTQSPYKLPGSTTLSILFAPTGEFTRVIWERKKPSFVERYMNEMWSWIKFIIRCILWIIFIIAALVIWIRVYL